MIHELSWLRLKDMLKSGCIPLIEFDKMTRKRIVRIMDLQDERLKEQQEQMEAERRKQDREMKRTTKF